ncbi:MAG: hypothetical protein JO147_03935 [Actinobacteria bacterium]|nr:hypothetical protein [Actinomycetota bacterium]
MTGAFMTGAFMTGAFMTEAFMTEAFMTGALTTVGRIADPPDRHAPVIDQADLARSAIETR